MTTEYNTSQCLRKVEAWTQHLEMSILPEFGELARQCQTKWEQRLIEATERAILINREIICQWEPVKLIDVIQQGHNPYMAVAALRLLVEDYPRISDHDIGCIILFTNPLHARFNIWHEINLLEGELDSRREQRYCPDCDCRRIDCECEDETPAQAAGFRQSDFI